MVINECIKEGLNRGREEQFYFYRDKTQREVDLLRLNALNLEAYEIKAGKSYQGDYFKHLRFLKELLGDQVSRTAVIYDGHTSLDAPFEGLYNYQDFSLYPD